VASVNERPSKGFEPFVQSDEALAQPWSSLDQQRKYDRRILECRNLLKEFMCRCLSIFDEHPLEQHIEKLERGDKDERRSVFQESGTPITKVDRAAAAYRVSRRIAARGIHKPVLQDGELILGDPVDGFEQPRLVLGALSKVGQR
jgi:hypothetical protein